MFGKRRWAAAVLMLMLVICSAFPAFAATRPINSVSLRITSDIQAGSSGGNVEVSAGDSRYYVEDCYITNEPSRNWNNGTKPKVRITLGVSDESYYFKSGFSKSNITISGEDATISSVSRSNSQKLVINVTLAAVDKGSGEYNLEVDDLQWDEGQGHGYWAESEDAKRYEVKVYRGSSLLNTSTLTTTNPTYDFSSYITKSGTYTFRVRAVYNSSYKGEWKESSEWYVDSELAREFRNSNQSGTTSSSTGPSNSSGTGSSGGPGMSGNSSGINTSGNSGGPGVTNNSGAWLLDNVGWWYCNADRSYTVNNWQYINNKWYYFNEHGYMVTGWVLWKNLYYYCGPNGDMLTNTWTPDGYYVDGNGVWVESMRR